MEDRVIDRRLKWPATFNEKLIKSGLMAGRGHQTTDTTCGETRTASRSTQSLTWSLHSQCFHLQPRHHPHCHRHWWEAHAHCSCTGQCPQSRSCARCRQAPRPPSPQPRQSAPCPRCPRLAAPCRGAASGPSRTAPGRAGTSAGPPPPRPPPQLSARSCTP